MSAQSWDPDRYAKNARFVSDLGAGVLELLAPKAGEKILDLGCGDGALTVKLVQRGCHALEDSELLCRSGARLCVAFRTVRRRVSDRSTFHAEASEAIETLCVAP